MEAQVLLDRLEANGNWLNKHYKEIYEKYVDEFVAVKEEDVIAHNQNLEVLLKELTSRNEDLNEVLIEFIHGKQYNIIL